MPDEHNRRTEPEPVSPPANDEGEALTDGNASQTKSPLISAVEIENFKGIGRPVRIDLRPITLLFGRNSAGKSTVLHALCFAHEILSHRNVDAHKTELGGDQVDLGGFRNFVHAHDLTRKVRLRFELNLEGWVVPRPLHEKLLAEYYDEHEMEVDVDSTVGALAHQATSGWVELQAQLRDGQPVLASYEVGVNEARVGRVHAQHQAGLVLEFNPAHPLLETALRRRPRVPGPLDIPHFDKNGMVEAPKSDTYADRVREAAGSTTDSGQISRVAVLGLASPLPHWSDLLLLDDRKLPSSVVHGEFQARVSALLVGIGHVLRDELAQLRYLGPLRDLHPPDDGERGRLNARRWANGSAAWDHLNDNARSDSRIVRNASAWLSREDRLDTGYELRERSDVTLPGDNPLVTRIHAWKRNRVVADPKHVSQLPASPGDVMKNAVPGMIEDLANTIAEAPVRKDVELVSIRTGLPVRTFDVGVGISQLLPIVVATLDPQRPGITAIEQPELHTHPRLQVELGDLFGQQADNGRILLVETHSEHLLLRIMRRMRQTNDGTLPDGAPEVRPEDVNVLFVEPDGAQTLIREMPLNERGELVEAWPGGFFEEDLREIF